MKGKEYSLLVKMIIRIFEGELFDCESCPFPSVKLGSQLCNICGLLRRYASGKKVFSR